MHEPGILFRDQPRPFLLLPPLSSPSRPQIKNNRNNQARDTHTRAERKFMLLLLLQCLYYWQTSQLWLIFQAVEGENLGYWAERRNPLYTKQHVFYMWRLMTQLTRIWSFHQPGEKCNQVVNSDRFVARPLCLFIVDNKLITKILIVLWCD